MNNRKLLLAYIRKGDYAHAGETEAIELTLKEVQKNPDQHLLDVGCGLGGTAHYLEKHGFGKVSGIDIDEEAIQYAKLHYPHVYFKQTDVLNVAQCFPAQKFNVIYSLNAFFCFKAQEDALKALASIATDQAELAIFDYSSKEAYTLENPFVDRLSFASSAQFFRPINLSSIEKQLSQNGWQLTGIEDLSSNYDLWYQWLVQTMDEQQKELKQLFGEKTFDDLYQGYSRLLTRIRQKELGGSVVRARRALS